MKNSEIYYTCSTDWLHEPIGDIRFFKTVKELKKACSCTEECGIVEVRMQAKWKKKGTR